MGDNHIIVAVYDPGGRTQTRSAYQYDYGQILRLEGFGDMLPSVFEVHFGIGGGASDTVIGRDCDVDIPDECLLRYGTLTAWLYLHDTDSDGETRYVFEIPVKPRAEITNYTPTPVQQGVIEQTIAALNDAVDRTEEAVEGAEEAKTAAETAAEEARESASTAGRQALNAFNSAQSAANSAGQASASASAASRSTTAASASASSANTSANNANTSANSAGQSADSAAQSASSAAQSAAAAQHSAENIENVVEVSPTEPTHEINKLWIVEESGTPVQVPTYAEHQTKADKADTVLDTTLSRGRKSESTVGKGSLAFGQNVEASGQYSSATGFVAKANGDFSHAEGQYTIADGNRSHAEGNITHAEGNNSHSEGSSTYAIGDDSHAEGAGGRAIGTGSHAEGSGSYALGFNAHVEGANRLATGTTAHAEGVGNRASLVSAINASKDTYTCTYNRNFPSQIKIGAVLVVENTFYGKITEVDSANHSITIDTPFDHDYTNASGVVFTADASGQYSHAEGFFTETSGLASHAEGRETLASGYAAHSEGYVTKAEGNYSHSEGNHSESSAQFSHAEGNYTIASGAGAHAEGNQTTASGYASHAEGFKATASGNYSHAEGYQTEASGGTSHAEGYQTVASNYYAHAEGGLTEASGTYSHAAGNHTIANGLHMNAIGTYNVADTPYPTWEADHQYEVGDRVVLPNGLGKVCNTANNDATYDASKWDSLPVSTEEGTAFVIGNGEDADHRSNAMRVDFDGDMELAGDLKINSGTVNEASISNLAKEVKSKQDALRVTSLTQIPVASGQIVDSVGIPVYVDDVSEYAGYGITETGWYAFVRITAKEDVTVSAQTAVTGADGYIATIGADHVDVAVRFGVAAQSKTVTVAWGNNKTETFVFRATDLAVRNLDYRSTFYIYDIADFAAWTWALTTDETFQSGVDYYTESGGEYTLATITVGDAVPAETYYVHTKLTFSGMIRNATYRFNETVDCPIEIVLPEVPDDGYGAWFEIQMRYSKQVSTTLVPSDSTVVIGTAQTQAQSAGINVIDLQYSDVNDVKMWTLLNTHSNLPSGGGT